MFVSESTRRQVADHLGQAEFALKVALNFECLQGTPAHEQVRVALAQVTAARAWTSQHLVVERLPVRQEIRPLCTGLPLTRKERLGYRWP